MGMNENDNVPECQAAYAKFGFVNASTAELRLKPIPD